MRHPPSLARFLPLTGPFVGLLLAGLLLVPATAHASADPVGDFYARMLDQHDGVFVDEELAGYLDREETAADLRSLLDEHDVRLSLLVVAAADDDASLDRIARTSAAEGADPILVFSLAARSIGRANLDASDVSGSAVDYAALTGGRPESPVDKLGTVLRVADEPDLERWVALAEAELPEVTPGIRSDLSSPPMDTWWEDERRNWWAALLGSASGVLAGWVLFALLRGGIRLVERRYVGRTP